MSVTGHDSLKTRRTLTVGGKSYDYFSLEAAAQAAGLGDISRLPFSLKVLLENLVRLENGRTVTVDDIKAVGAWLKTKTSDREIAFRPARVLMQDLTGVPAVVDLAAMREAMVELGGDPEEDQSAVAGRSRHRPFGDGRQFRQRRMPSRTTSRSSSSATASAIAFLRWGQEAFDNFRVVPPGTGICHQVNLEYLAQVVWTTDEDGKTIAYPDTLVGTDSHTTMVNGLAVLGWGVGGIEAEAAMLGQPISMLIPEVVGFKLHRQAARRRDRDRSRAHRDADAAQEGRGRQVRRILRPGHRRAGARRPRDHRQHGAGIWRDLRLLPDRRRDASAI